MKVRGSQADLPSEWSTTGPAKIFTVDVERPFPDIPIGEQYREAWAVLRRQGVPRAMVVIDLDDDAATGLQDRLRDRISQLKGEPDDTQVLAIPDDRLPRISIVIPTIVSRIDDLVRCLIAVEELEYPDFEVVLVDNRPVRPSSDPLVQIAGDRPWLDVIWEPLRGISAARNAGIRRATGDVVAFTDDDVVVERNWLRAIGTRFATNPLLDAVTGLILPAELESAPQIWFERYYGGFGGERSYDSLTLESDRRGGLRGASRVLVRDSQGAVIERIFFFGIGGYGAGANMAFRRSSLSRIGDFDLALGTGTASRGGEDLAAMIAILWTGGQICYEPASVVYHRHRSEYSELLKQMHGFGLGFTAMLTSFALSDVQHFLTLASLIPRAMTKGLAKGVDTVRKRQPESAPDDLSPPFYPAALSWYEHRAYLSGPYAYLRSRYSSRTKRSTKVSGQVGHVGQPGAEPG
jgi:glycosyltransferase involved in cell wall biosynthesis